MESQVIVRGYLTQILRGCDSCECDNEWCRSSPNFKFEFKDKKDAMSFATGTLARNHVKENHLCNGLSHLQLDPTIGEQVKQFPSSENFSNLQTLDKSKVMSIMTNKLLIPYIFVIKGSKDSQLNDNDLDFIGEIILNNAEYFSDLEKELTNLVKSITDKSLETKETKNLVKLETYEPLETREHSNLIIILLYYLSLFPTNDLSDSFVLLLGHLFNRKNSTILYIKNQLSKTTKTLQRILSFTQENLTFATLSIEDQNDLSIISIVRLICLLRDANPLIPSTAFSNEIFTETFMKSKDEILHFINATDHICYLKYPAVLSLPFKFRCLSQFYQIIQSSIMRQDIFALMNNGDLLFSIEVSRANIVEDTINKLTSTNSSDLVKKLNVVFTGEQGVDVGGVSREFFYLLCNEIFSEKYGFFYELKNGKFWFVSPFVGRMIDFQALGTIVALAVYNSIILPIRFPLLLYKKLYNVKTTFEDYEEIDPDLVASWRNLLRMKANGDDISQADMNFTVTQDNYGAIVEIPLCEDGENKKVTNQNVEEYVELHANWLINKSIEPQFSKFEAGFNKLSKARRGRSLNIPDLDMYEIIHYDELDILVSGEEIVTWDVLRENAAYSDGYTQDSQQVKWFWEIFAEMTNDEKQNFFRFSTGSDRAPVGGLHKFKLVIQKTNDPTKLPVSHTCFNIFALPTYESKEEMKRKILISIANFEGFGLI